MCTGKTRTANILCVGSHWSENNGVFCPICGCGCNCMVNITSKKRHSCPTQMLDIFSLRLKVKLHQFGDHKLKPCAL